VKSRESRPIELGKLSPYISEEKHLHYMWYTQKEISASSLNPFCISSKKGVYDALNLPPTNPPSRSNLPCHAKHDRYYAQKKCFPDKCVCVCVMRVYVPKRGPMLSARISPKTPSHVCVHVMRQVKETTKVNKNCDRPPLAVTQG
jgi:hypothetical protein